jgi:hypothetical protein
MIDCEDGDEKTYREGRKTEDEDEGGMTDVAPALARAYRLAVAAHLLVTIIAFDPASHWTDAQPITRSPRPPTQ